jgi:hypothetical protein
LSFQDTKAGKLHCEVTSLLMATDVPEDELRELLLRYLASSEVTILYNMKAYIVMQQLIEGLMLNQSMTETGKVISVQFPEQVKVLQTAVDKMLTLIGRKVNNETSK